MATINGEVSSAGVAGINVTALRARLKSVGQVLEPRAQPPSPPAPPPSPTPPPLSGDEWYAWKDMWNVQHVDISQGSMATSVVSANSGYVLSMHPVAAQWKSVCVFRACTSKIQ